MKLLAIGTLVSSFVIAAPQARAQCPQLGKFTTADMQDKFGRGVSAARGFVAASAPNDSSILDQEGKVFIYQDIAGTWGLSATIQPPNLDPTDLFGFSVAAHDRRVAASALYDDDQGVDSGAVYVYRATATGWVLEQKLVNPVPGDQLSYGRAIAMSDDLLAVARWGPPAVVFVYRRSGQVWSLDGTLTPSFPDQRYGTDVAVNGNVVVVGDPEYGISEGALEVYRFSSGVGWQSEYVTFGSIGSSLGFSVDVYRGHAVAGAWEAGAGGAEVHTYDSVAGTWSLQQSLIGSDSIAGDGFGYTVSIASSGIYCGAPGHDSLGTNTGAVYAFTFAGGTWSQANKIVPNGLIDFDNFGTTLDATADLLGVGNRFQVFGPPDSRAVFVFQPCP